MDIWIVAVLLVVLWLGSLAIVCLALSRSRRDDGCERAVAAATEKICTRVDGMDRAVELQMGSMRESTAELAKTVHTELDAVRKTVDEELAEHLDKKLTDSFKQVSEQLTEVYRSLGEMNTLAQGVGDLKKVLTNVKARGILGEVQLKAIIEDILAKGQYEENVATVKGSSERVEFAVKLPVEGGFVWLPIDAKFPGDSYAALQSAYESGDRDRVDVAAKVLCNRLRQEAKDIRDKYVQVPDTTEFAIMFLPFEGLYAEAVNRGMVEVLQRDYRVNIAGPSTMAAMLNSLQMSFRTIAIQRRSAEVWEVLGAVQTEFDKFDEVLGLAQNRLDQAGRELEKLHGTRVRAIQRRLKGVAALPEEQAAAILKIED